MGLLSCRENGPVVPTDLLVVGEIAVQLDPSRSLERGTRDTLTVVARDPDGQTITVPIVWRSSNEQVAIFERGGVLVALDTGLTLVTASSLGVTSQPVDYRVVWRGAAYIDSAAWTRPSALMPGVTLTDSVRVRVTNIDSVGVAGARVRFVVTEGGGSMSPAIAVTNANGIASSRWTLGPSTGTNTVTASVVRADDTSDPLVADNLVTYSITAYNALEIVAGNDQTGQILSTLPTNPSVRVVDSLGAPRPGVPVTFVAFQNGRVATPVVSTGSDGVASPGSWTLGDIPGAQTLEARVSDARISFTATATGTPEYYTPSSVIAGGFSTCALEADASVKCWGESPQIGSGGTTNVFTPTPTSPALSVSTVAGGPSHFCAVDAAGVGYCWGDEALVDTSGATTDTISPAAIPTDLLWSSVSPGLAHNCGVTVTNDAYCWGTNTDGRLGDGTTSTTRRFVPTAVVGGFKFASLSAGNTHTCGLSTAQQVFCWGSNSLGQLGNGGTTGTAGPTAVSGGLTFQSVGTGESYSCGLSTSGQTYCWGRAFTTVRLTPTSYPNAPVFTSLTVGTGHACGLAADGAAYCWGNNAFGQVGDSTTTTRNEPTAVAGGLRFAQLSAGRMHTCGRTTDGAVACWGQNRGGELGDETAAFYLVPRRLVLGVQP